MAVCCDDPETAASTPRLRYLEAWLNGRESNHLGAHQGFQNHAFVVSGGTEGHGMQVFDLAQLRGVTEPRDFTSAAVYTGVESAINLAVNEETGFAYLTGSTGDEPCGGGLHMVDIGNPVDPVFAGCFADPETGRRGTGTSHDTQCVVSHGPDETTGPRDLHQFERNRRCPSRIVTTRTIPFAVPRLVIRCGALPPIGVAHRRPQGHFYMGDELDEFKRTGWTVSAP